MSKKRDHQIWLYKMGYIKFLENTTTKTEMNWIRLIINSPHSKIRFIQTIDTMTWFKKAHKSKVFYAPEDII